MLLVVWTGLVFLSGAVLVGGGVVVDTLAPAERGQWAVALGLLGAYCVAGLVLHLLRYLVLLSMGLIWTGELIGATRQFRRARQPRATIDEPTWFARLTSPSDVDLLVQALVVSSIVAALVLAGR